MNEVTEQFINFWQPINDVLFVVQFILAGIIAIGLVVGVFYKHANNILGDILIIGSGILFGVCLIIIVFFMLSTNLFSYNLNLKQAIKKEYQVEITSTLELTTIAEKEVVKTSVSSISDLDTKEDHFLFLPTTTQNEYKVYVANIDNNWQLCKLDLNGNFIPLDSTRTIQDLKEN